MKIQNDSCFIDPDRLAVSNRDPASAVWRAHTALESDETRQPFLPLALDALAGE
jgi:hypothetical protein